MSFRPSALSWPNDVERQLTHPFVVRWAGDLAGTQIQVLHPARRKVSRDLARVFSAGALRAPDSESPCV